MSRSLILIPWHIGNMRDVTVHAAQAARGLRVFLAEEPELTRRQFETELGIDCRGKEFLLIPEAEDPVFLEGVAARLRDEDVALICSGGIPCFIDPGAWLVRLLRSREVPVSALAGASILSTMLSLSGVEWTGKRNRGTFVVYLPAGPGGGAHASVLEAARREDEPVFVFLALDRFRECLASLEPVLGGRLVSAFFDLTKVPRSKFPYADRILTADCAAWRLKAESLPWKDISDVALMLHPRETPS